jgi:NAD+--asparagine ADP-ribosyltransferase
VFLAIDDDATCEACLGMDGNMVNVSDMQVGFNAPPLHPHCRCSTAVHRDEKQHQEWLQEQSNVLSGVGAEASDVYMQSGYPVHFKTGGMGPREYAQNKYRNSNEHSTIYLPKTEYAGVMSELNTHLSVERGEWILLLSLLEIIFT